MAQRHHMRDLAIELKTRIPELQICCDPSHICGIRDLIGFIAQKALDLDMAGLMIESHIHPDSAWSDANQQVTPAARLASIEPTRIQSR